MKNTQLKQAQIIPDNEQQYWDYRFFLRQFLEMGYKFVFFNEMDGSQNKVALRHDIDFDTHLALKNAQEESDMGIKSTYFFLLRSQMYNVFSNSDFQNIQSIRELGHKISIHFDPVIYADFEEGFRQELTFFQRLFNERVDIVSIHRPNNFFLNLNQPIAGIEHTYMNKYCTNIKYFSDSTGKWRHGNPTTSAEFVERMPLHVLTHPIWWMVAGKNNQEILTKYYRQRVSELNNLFYLNCIPFRDIHDSV